jgi:hypothetical protein
MLICAVGHSRAGLARYGADGRRASRRSVATERPTCQDKSRHARNSRGSVS